jgi:hypothetical protein
VDLNHRPHAYQACALNQLSYRPGLIPLRLLTLVSKNRSLGPWKLNSKRFDLNAVLLPFEPPPWCRLLAPGADLGLVARRPKATSTLLRKEVIQPQVPLRLPCYDFTPVTSHSLGTCLPCGLARPLLEQLTPMV